MIHKLTYVPQLAQAFNGALAQERIQRVTLQSTPEPPMTVVRHAERDTDPHPSEPAEHGALEAHLSPVVSSVVTTPAQITPRDIYLQFWFPTLSTGREDDPIFSSAQASTTTTPVPYALTSSYATAQQLHGCVFNGTYDSRMDTDITSRTHPIILSKVINFDYKLPKVPKVAVWLTGLCATSGAAVSVQAIATDIETTQFILQIDSSSGDHLLSVGAAWAVWEEEDTVAIGSKNSVQPEWGMLVSHTVWTMLLAAMSGIKLVLEQELCVKLYVTMQKYSFDDTKLWHFNLRLSGVSECSVTMVHVMRR